MKRKMISLLLGLVMALAVLPMAAMAAGTATVTVNGTEGHEVGTAKEFTVTTNATEDMVGKTVVGQFTYDASKVDKLEYFETTDSTWKELTGNSFGPSSGFPLADGATSQFRVTFKEAGTCNVEIKIVEVGTDTQLASTTAQFQVAAKTGVAMIGGDVYATLEEAVANAVSGNEIKLMTDLELTKGSALALAVDGVTLNLNGHTLTVHDPITISGNGVTVINGTIKAAADFPADNLITVNAPGNSASVRLLALTVDATGGQTKYGVHLYQTGYEVEMGGCTFVNNSYAGVLVNGSQAKITGATSFNLSGSCYAGVELGKGSGVTANPGLALVGSISFANSNPDTTNNTRLIWTDSAQVQPGDATIQQSASITVNGEAKELDANGMLVTPAPKPTPKPTPKPSNSDDEESASPAPAAATPAPVLDSTPKTGEAGWIILPIFAAGLAVLGIAAKKLTE